MGRCFTIGLILLALARLKGATADDQGDEWARLTGEYAAETMLRTGQVPADAEVLKGLSLEIGRNAWVQNFRGEIAPYQMTLDLVASPKGMRLVHQKVQAVRNCTYVLEGDSLTVTEQMGEVNDLTVTVWKRKPRPHDSQAEESAATLDAALEVVPFNTNPGPEYQAAARLYQGVPGIARDDKSGRLWATWYSGGRGEDKFNYVVVVTSGDDGTTWTDAVLVVDPPGNVRTSDSCLWTAPDGRLHFFYTQNDATRHLHDGRWGVWLSICADPSRADSTWSTPIRICDGLMLNKPTVLRDGTWLLPVANWYDRKRGAGIVRSVDNGKTLTWIGGAPGRNAYWNAEATTGGGMEHMIVERKDGTLWMPMRIDGGLCETTSTDGGVTWSPPTRSAIEGPGARFHVRRLRSGRLLLINYVGFSRDVPVYAQRSHLTALISEDDGKTWPHRLLLDERSLVSYPDAVETPDGELRIIYDRGRTSAREILLAKTNEADIIAGKSGPATQLRILISKASGAR